MLGHVAGAILFAVAVLAVFLGYAPHYHRYIAAMAIVDVVIS